MKSLKVTDSLMTTIESLYKKGEIEESFYQAVLAGKKIAEDRTLYVRKEISGAGIIQLITDSLDSKTGVTNITKARLAEGELMLVKAVHLGHAIVADTVISPAAVKYSTEQNADIPAELRNADFIVQQSQGRLFTFPVSDLLHGAASRDNTAEHGLQLEVPRVIKPQKRLDYNLEIPEELTLTIPASSKLFVEFAVKGIIFRDRATA